MKAHRFSRVLALCGGFSLVLLSACEGGRFAESPAAGARATELLPVDDGRGIQAEVGGVLHAFRGDMRVTVSGEYRRNLHVLNQARDADSWAIEALTMDVGEYSCGDRGLQITLLRAGQSPLTTAAGGSCTVSVTHASNRRIEGRFTGALADAGASQSMHNGIFRFELAHAIPDSDADGLADADDNCPFDANPDQADGNGNGAGTACDGSEQE